MHVDLCNCAMRFVRRDCFNLRFFICAEAVAMPSASSSLRQEEITCYHRHSLIAYSMPNLAGAFLGPPTPQTRFKGRMRHGLLGVSEVRRLQDPQPPESPFQTAGSSCSTPKAQPLKAEATTDSFRNDSGSEALLAMRTPMAI